MGRQVIEQSLVIASHNRGKISEIEQLLKPFSIVVENAAELKLPEPDETENSYISNAVLKARAAAMESGLPALSDDSGFELMAINKDPGLYSARWAGPNKDFSAAMKKVNQAFTDSGSDNRHCRFVCALAIVWPDGHSEAVEGIIDGSFVWPPRGDKGFGYDPVFQLGGHDKTFAEIEPDLKNSISHRAQAFEKLLNLCFRDMPRVACKGID